MTTEIITVQNVRGYIDATGTAHLNAEDVARGLGFVDYQEKDSATSGKKTYEVIRWARVNGYLKEFGIKPVSKGDYIPEYVFYLLAMKAKNNAAQRFQTTIATEILPQFRKSALLMKILSNPVELANILGITDFKPAEKCAYVLEMENGSIKIGVTQDFNRRIKEIMNGSGMEIVRSYHTEKMGSREAFKVEHASHKTFSDERKRGEFFNVEFNNACDEVKKKVDVHNV